MTCPQPQCLQHLAGGTWDLGFLIGQFPVLLYPSRLSDHMIHFNDLHHNFFLHLNGKVLKYSLIIAAITLHAFQCAQKIL